MYLTVGFIFFCLILVLSVVTFCIEKYRKAFLLEDTLGYEIDNEIKDIMEEEDEEAPLTKLLVMYLILFAIYFAISLIVALVSIILWPIVGVAMILSYFKFNKYQQKTN